MEVITMEKKAFDLMMARYDALVKKVELLKHKANGKRLNKWLTGCLLYTSPSPRDRG